MAAAALGMQTDLLFGATAEAVKISQAWVPPAEPAGADVPLLMTIKNEADVAILGECSSGKQAVERIHRLDGRIKVTNGGTLCFMKDRRRPRLQPMVSG